MRKEDAGVHISLPQSRAHYAGKKYTMTIEQKTQSLIALGKKNGKLTEEEIAEALAEYENPDFGYVYEAIRQAGVTIEENEPIDDLDLTKITPEADWAGGSMDSISMYLHEIAQYPVPTKDEEEALTKTVYDGNMAKQSLDEGGSDMPEAMRNELKKLVKAGKKAKDELVERNLRLVVSVARRYQNNGLPLLDLIQNGNMGLMIAIDKFEPNRGLRLSTYATYWIRQVIIRELANTSRNIRIPVHISEELRKVKTTAAVLGGDTGATTEQIAEAAGMTEERVSFLLTLPDTCSMNNTVGKDGEDEFADFIVSDELGVHEQIEQGALRDALINTMDAVLRPKEKQVLMLRFGMTEDHRPKTLEEVGAMYGVTRERIRQIEGTALRKMKVTGRKRSFVDFLEN